MSSLATSTIGDLSRLIRTRSQPLPDLHSHEAFAAHFDVFADAKIVLLGEASHGTAEFYKARAAITHRLVERHGFRILALEADRTLRAPPRGKSLFQANSSRNTHGFLAARRPNGALP